MFKKKSFSNFKELIKNLSIKSEINEKYLKEYE